MSEEALLLSQEKDIHKNKVSEERSRYNILERQLCDSQNQNSELLAKCVSCIYFKFNIIIVYHELCSSCLLLIIVYNISYQRISQVLYTVFGHMLSCYDYLIFDMCCFSSYQEYMIFTILHNSSVLSCNMVHPFSTFV